MNQIPALFAQYFENWQITLPEEDFKNRQRGTIQERGWHIKYLFGEDEKGEYLDFLAEHRMTNERHVRLYASGKTESLPCFSPFIVYPKDANEAQKKQIEAEHQARNLEIMEILRQKGFM